MLQITAQLKSINKSSVEKGFTLVELLIVIAILGVLAAVVLVAINPIEQINRGADAGRESAVSQVGRALLAWQTSQQQSDFSGITAATWQTNLTSTNELKQQVTVNAATGNCTTNNVGGICYSYVAPNAVVWTILASKSESIRAGGGTACANFAAVIWDSSQGKAGVTCLATANGATTGLSLH